MKALIIAIGLIIGITTYGQKADNKLTNHELIQKQTENIFDNLVKVRRDIYSNPELSGKEIKTSKIIEEYLLSLGLEVKTNIGGYGIVGILNGDKEGKKIAWRADIDAVRNHNTQAQEAKHMCGHDIHTVVALGIADILSKQKENIEGTVYFVFQPSEENFEGAKAMINDGLFDIIEPDEFYALHMFPTPIGTISAKPNEVFSYQRRIKISYKNKENKDDLKKFTRSLSQEFMRMPTDRKLWDFQNFTDPKVGLSNPETIYKDYLIWFFDQYLNIEENNNSISFESTIYETNMDNLNSLLNRLKERILKSQYKDQLISVDYTLEMPLVKNDETLTKESLNTISLIYGDKCILSSYGQVPFFNDDFTFFQQKVPGVYFLLGGSNREKGINSMPHAADYSADEDCIKIGVKYFSSMIIERIKYN